MSPIQPIRRALMSVTDKSGLVDFARPLAEAGVEILSTGGTGKALAEAGIPFTEVSAYTGSPEIFGGRVKTLHPKIHGGLLMRRGYAGDAKQAKEQGSEAIDMVVVNLYQFEKTAAKEGVEFEQVIEAIDIGGPGMIRSAAKNHRAVAVVTSPDQYTSLIEEFSANQGLSGATLKRLAAAAFEHTARYDRAIANWFTRQLEEGETGADAEFPSTVKLNLTLQQSLRYGENPHQGAAFYTVQGEEAYGVAACQQLHGKALSFNNLIDADIALQLPYEFDEQAVAILKHTTPSGVAIGATLAEAEAAARACDPQSAFGGIVGMNRICDEATASQINKAFTEVVVAPGYTDEALAILSRKKNIRLLVAPKEAAKPFGWDIRRVNGGVLVEDRDYGFPELNELTVATKRQPTPEELAAMKFGWVVCKYVKSNAVLFAKGTATLGLGAGQMSRVDAVHVAAWKAGEAGIDLKGSVLASDAFFPFPDGLLAAVEAGATAVIQPGGSVNDPKVIEAADEAGIAMLLTGRRHFRHA